MNILEQRIAETIGEFLVVRGDRIACDTGLLEIRRVHGALVAFLDQDMYGVEIIVSRLT